MKYTCKFYIKGRLLALIYQNTLFNYQIEIHVMIRSY